MEERDREGGSTDGAQGTLGRAACPLLVRRARMGCVTIHTGMFEVMGRKASPGAVQGPQAMEDGLGS